MNIRLTLPVRVVLPVAVLLTLVVGGRSRSRSRLPSQDRSDAGFPVTVPDEELKFVAASFDSIAFAVSRSGTYLPLIQLYSNTVNYPGQLSFAIQSYVGSPPSH